MTRPYMGCFEDTYGSLRVHVDIENPRTCYGRNRRYLEENGDIQKYANSVTDKCRVVQSLFIITFFKGALFCLPIVKYYTAHYFI